MSFVETLRCPGCGGSRHCKHFGINEDGEFDPELVPAHEIERIVRAMEGRGRIRVVERGAVSLTQAKAMRASMMAAVARLDAEIAEAEGEVYEPDADTDE